MSGFSDDDIDSNPESEGEYDPDHASDIDTRMEDDVDTLDGVD